MIYDVNGSLFLSFVSRTGQGGGPKVGPGVAAKGVKARGSDGKYQGE